MAALPFGPTWNWNVFQNSYYIAINISSILYGMQLFLYFKTMHTILSNRKICRTSAIFYAFFSTLMVLLITLWVATQAVFGQQMWLLNPDFPGGPDAYWQEHITDWYMDLGITGLIALQLMTDALMIHRCRIVWNSYRAIIIPVMLWLVTLTLGILMDLTGSAPAGNLLFGIDSRFGLAYWTTSVFLNTSLTCAICYRIIRHGKLVQKNLGREHASLYFSTTTIIVEAMLPYTMSAIPSLVSCGMGSPTSVAFGSIHVLTVCISPQMLIFRVITGRAWTNDTTSQSSLHSTIHFDPGSTQELEQVDSAGVRVHLQRLSDSPLPDGHDKV